MYKGESFSLFSYEGEKKMKQKPLTVYGLAGRNLQHRKTRTIFLILLVMILSATLFVSRILTESMRQCIDKTVDRIGADVIVAPAEYEADLSDSLFSGGQCSFYFDRSLMDDIKTIDGIEKMSPQLYITSLDAACCSVPVQIVAFDSDSDFIVKSWLAENHIQKLKKGEVVVGSKINSEIGGTISFFNEPFTIAAKLEETGTSYDNCTFMDVNTAYTLFNSFQMKYVTDLTDPQNYVSLVMIKVKDGTTSKKVADTINTKMRASGLKAYTAKAMSGNVTDTLNQMQFYSSVLIMLLFVMAILALVCIFNITVNERLKEFGAMISVGVHKSQIFKMLLLEAGIIGGSGGVLGVMISGGGILLFSDIIIEKLHLTYFNIAIKGYAVLALQSILLAVVVSLLATLYAAIRVSRMETYKLIQEVES